MEKKDINLLKKSDLSDNIRDFFTSLNEENEEKYILGLKNKSLKLWTFYNKDGLTSLHQSISLNLFELSKEIIKSAHENLSQKDYSSFINWKTNKGQTPLHYASFVGNIKIIKLLIQNGADFLSKTNNGFNVLHLATMGNKITSFFYFIKKYNISIKSIDNKENTSLHLATYFNSKKIFNYLLTNNQIDINSKNKEGFTPLHFAVVSQNKSMIKKLLIKGANCSIKNDKLFNPPELAKKNNFHSLKNIFKRHICKYQILMYSRLFTIFLIILNIIPPLFFILSTSFGVISIIYIIWLFIYLFSIYRFYKINPSSFNKDKNYLLNLLEIEEKPIEDYCIKCQIIQRSGTIHCLICNECVEGFDHHCFWINKCIGMKNKKYFYQLIWTVIIHFIINFIISFFIIPEEKLVNNDILNMFRIFFIVFNALILIISSFIICPLIKFYYYQAKAKTSNSIDFNEHKSTRLLNKLDEEDSIII